MSFGQDLLKVVLVLQMGFVTKDQVAEAASLKEGSLLERLEKAGHLFRDNASGFLPGSSLAVNVLLLYFVFRVSYFEFKRLKTVEQ
jgi:hypothetical protein